MKDLISVIIPVYNEETNLRRCVDSIINQTYKNLEIILIDDGSTDNSGSICDMYSKKDERIKTIHKKNGGLSSARNAGLDIAQGQYIGFVDSDDWVSLDMYGYLLGIIHETKADVAQIEYTYVSSEKDSEKVRDRSGRILCLNDQETILSRYLRDGMKVIKSYAVCTKLYKRECFTSIRFPIGQLYEDIVTNYDILSNSLGYAISDKICYYYFRKNGSITRTKYTCRDNDYIRDGEQLLERTQGIKNLYKYAKMSLARYYFMCICKMMKYGFADDVDVKGITDRGISIIRENLIILLTSPMAVSRKIVLIAVSLNKWAVVKIIKMANRVYDKND